MSGHWERGLYRGKRVYTEADAAWSDSDLEDREAYLASLRSRRLHPTFRHLPEDGDSLKASETERDWHEESTW